MHAQTGDTVKVHYTGKFSNGEIFDTSQNKSPLELTIGEGKFLPAFEQAIIGMEEGDKKTITLTPDQGYGEYNDDLVADFNKDQLPENMEIHLGDILQLQDNHGHIFNVEVIEVGETQFKVDANHPLAGKDLTFEIELVEIMQ